MILGPVKAKASYYRNLVDLHPNRIHPEPQTQPPALPPVITPSAHQPVHIPIAPAKNVTKRVRDSPDSRDTQHHHHLQEDAAEREKEKERERERLRLREQTESGRASIADYDAMQLRDLQEQEALSVTNLTGGVNALAVDSSPPTATASPEIRFPEKPSPEEGGGRRQRPRPSPQREGEKNGARLTSLFPLSFVCEECCVVLWEGGGEGHE